MIHIFFNQTQTFLSADEELRVSRLSKMSEIHENPHKEFIFVVIAF